VDGSQSSRIVAGESLVAGQGIRINFNLVAQGLQAQHATFKGRLIADRA
jgi:hypothetical protein